MEDKINDIFNDLFNKLIKTKLNDECDIIRDKIETEIKEKLLNSTSNNELEYNEIKCEDLKSVIYHSYDGNAYKHCIKNKFILKDNEKIIVTKYITLHDTSNHAVVEIIISSNLQILILISFGSQMPTISNFYENYNILLPNEYILLIQTFFEIFEFIKNCGYIQPDNIIRWIKNLADLIKNKLCQKNISKLVEYDIKKFESDVIIVYNDKFQKEMKLLFDNMKIKVINEIKNEKINNNHKGSYPKINDIKFDEELFEKIRNNKLPGRINNNNNGFNYDQKEFLLLNWNDDEKLIIQFEYRYDESRIILMITNYCKLFKIVSGRFSKDAYVENFEYKIPDIYIILLKNISNELDDNTNNKSKDFTFNFFKSYLETIKEISCSRQYIPLYVEDIIKENNYLKEKHEAIKKYLIEKENFEKNIKPYIDLQKETELLKEKKETLKLFKMKLELKEKEINEKIKRFEELDFKNIDDL